jgi:hypothetical protein
MWKILPCAALSISLFSASSVIAETEMTELERVQHIVIMNSDGLVSIRYDVEWPWERKEHSDALYYRLVADLKEVTAQCEAVNKMLLEDQDTMLGPNLRNATISIFHEREIHPVLLMNAILRKYAVKHPVDIETNEDRGIIKAIRSAHCNNFDSDNYGMLQNMFYLSESEKQHRYFADVLCGKFKKASLCLRDNFTISESRQNAASQTIEFDRSNILEPVRPPK